MGWVIAVFLNSFEGFPPGVTVGYAKSHIKDILKAEFNKSVELQVNENILSRVGESDDDWSS